MVDGLREGLVGAVALCALLLCFAGSAQAVEIEPPWCAAICSSAPIPIASYEPFVLA